MQGSTIEQLNRSWQFSTSLKEVLLNAKYFNLIALAALTAKLTIIDGTLLQKAFSTEIRQDAPVHYNLTGYANMTIPMTGRVSGRGAQPGLLAKNFNDDLKIWAQGGGLLPNTYAGCEGLCYLHVPGAGFEFDCNEPQQATINNGNQTQEALMAYNSNPACSLTNATTNRNCTRLEQNLVAPLFHLEFTAHYDNSLSYNEYYSGTPGGPNYSYITMELLYTSANDEGENGQGSCPGSKYTQTCRLRPAVVNYPVKIEQYKDSHTLTSMSLGVDPNAADNSTFRDFNTTLKQQIGFDIIRYNDIHETHASIVDDTRTRLGGVAQGLNMYLGGNASMYWGGAAGFYLDQSGNAPTYLINDLGTQEGKEDSSFYCGFQYVNPMVPQSFKDNAAAGSGSHYDVPSVVGKINQIMFALALDISNEDDDKDVLGGSLSRPATVYKDTIHYVTNTKYMWGAFASILVCILCVLPVYWGYWQLGREVTLGPFEIAAAFRAPNLYHPTNPPVKELIKEVGDREVKFGQIITGGDAGKIAVAEPQHVARIHPSAKVSNIRSSMMRPTSTIQSGSQPNTP